jgi:hypothetical protein
MSTNDRDLPKRGEVHSARPRDTNWLANTITMLVGLLVIIGLTMMATTLFAQILYAP